MKTVWRYVINVGFIVISVVICALMITRMEKERKENAIDPLDGFRVFLEGEEISALYLAEDSLWVGGRDGVKRLDPETGQVIDYVAEDLELIYAAEICRWRDGSVWIGHNEGVTVLTDDGKRIDFAEPEMTGGRVNTILCVDEGVLVGTMEGVTEFTLGANGWSVSELRTKENGLLSDVVNVLAEIEEEMWFGSYLDNRPGGLSIKRGDVWQYVTIEDGLSHPYINAILPISDSVLVATGQLTAGGLNRLSKSGEHYVVTDTFNMEDGIPGEKVRWLYKDTAGHLWITTESNGLLVCKTEEIDHPIDGVLLVQEHGLSDNEIKKIVESEKYYWLAGRYGLTRIEKSAIENCLGGK
ncbi:MAG: hypothetical protein IIX65_00140 [Lachnospiraceae bacterium]|nr:hypothetical protein [Lachnospiraceae bacterium]